MSVQTVPKGRTILVHLDVTIAPTSTRRPQFPLLSDLLICRGTVSFKTAGPKVESWLLFDKIATDESVCEYNALRR